jgi:hypothetical protein
LSFAPLARRMPPVLILAHQCRICRKRMALERTFVIHPPRPSFLGVSAFKLRSDADEVIE